MRRTGQNFHMEGAKHEGYDSKPMIYTRLMNQVSRNPATVNSTIATPAPIRP